MITDRPWKYADTMIVDGEGFTIARSGHVHDAVHIVRCVNERDALIAALRKAKETIQSWHDLQTEDIHGGLWGLYQSSPEMKQINEALENAERS